MKTVTRHPKPQPVRAQYHRIRARVTPELKELILDAAAMRGVTLNDFLTNSARDAAVQTIEQHKLVSRIRAASIRFANALLRAAKSDARRLVAGR